MKEVEIEKLMEYRVGSASADTIHDYLDDIHQKKNTLDDYNDKLMKTPFLINCLSFWAIGTLLIGLFIPSMIIMVKLNYINYYGTMLKYMIILLYIIIISISGTYIYEKLTKWLLKIPFFNKKYKIIQQEENHVHNELNVKLWEITNFLNDDNKQHLQQFLINNFPGLENSHTSEYHYHYHQVKKLWEEGQIEKSLDSLKIIFDIIQKNNQAVFSKEFNLEDNIRNLL